MVLVMEVLMDLTTIMSTVTATLFWLLVLVEMTFATGVFCTGNKDYDQLVRQLSVRTANSTLWVSGFFALAMPVLQAGQWLHGSAAWAWCLVLGTGSLIVLIVVIDERDRRGKS
jgi:hypothetical protein